MAFYPVVAYHEPSSYQLSLFEDFEHHQLIMQQSQQQYNKERQLYTTMEVIKKKYGKNSVLKASSLLKHSTIKMRNQQIGGHLA